VLGPRQFRMAARRGRASRCNPRRCEPEAQFQIRPSEIPMPCRHSPSGAGVPERFVLQPALLHAQKPACLYKELAV